MLLIWPQEALSTAAGLALLPWSWATVMVTLPLAVPPLPSEAVKEMVVILNFLQDPCHQEKKHSTP